jgi:acylphosphatase
MATGDICKHVIYTGKVQGVGFRYTTEQLAGGFAVTGYVRNLSNGNVELVAQGAADQVAGFLAGVRQQMTDYIRSEDVRDESVQEFREFSIRY